MLPTKAVRRQLGELLAADATTLAPAADANKVALIKEAFVPNENLTIDDLEFADFTGSTPLLAGTGTQQCAIDPATGQQIVTIKEPAGGWRWETTDAVHLAQTIYGYALTDNDGTTLLGTGLLPSPIALTAAGQEVNIGTVKMAIVDEPLS